MASGGGKKEHKDGHSPRYRQLFRRKAPYNLPITENNAYICGVINRLVADNGKMETITSSQFAALYGLSERTVRNYCREGKLAGAVLVGKTWSIPADALPPERGRHRVSPLLKALEEQKAARVKGGVYHRVQIDLTYSSNHIEGSRLSREQTRMIFESQTVVPQADVAIKVDDIIETVNHFRCVDCVIDHATAPLTEGFIKQLHKILKSGTADSARDWFAVGDYKRLANEVGGMETTAPEAVGCEMGRLLDWYGAADKKDEETVIEFHYRFEAIHPFQDGNGRVGRLVMFKECLANGIVPFIIDEDLRYFYYRGLREWPRVRGYLIDTCLTAQDKFKAMLDYFRIKY